MSRRKIEMYEYQAIISRLKEGQKARAIMRDRLAGRKKIAAILLVAQEQGWLKENVPIPDNSTLSGFFENKAKIKQESSVAIYHAEVEKWVAENIQASTIYQHLTNNFGFTGAYNSVQRFVKKIKNQQPPNLTVPLDFKIGEAVQVDFGQGPILFDQRVNQKVKTWFFVMTLCWSRHQYAEIITHQDIETWLNCHKNSFEWFGGVPLRIIIDNPRCAITKACFHDPELQRSYECFAQEYKIIISACPPRDPQKKGRVESGVKYIKKNFQPLRNLTSVQDAYSQLKAWILEVAGNRKHGSTFKKPLTQFEEFEKSQLKSLPISAPDICVWRKVSLYRDCHIRFQKCKYSAPYKLFREDLWLKSTPTIIAIYHNHESVAFHSRLFIPGGTSTKIEHLPPKAKFFFSRDSDWCLAMSTKIGANCKLIIEDLLTDPVRDLLRQAQLILKLSAVYGETRLENACKRAVTYYTHKYISVKNILEKGLDSQSINEEEAFESLGDAYTGSGIFQRSLTNTIN